MVKHSTKVSAVAAAPIIRNAKTLTFGSFNGNLKKEIYPLTPKLNKSINTIIIVNKVFIPQSLLSGETPVYYLLKYPVG